MRRVTKVGIASISVLLLAGTAVSAAKPEEVANFFRVSGEFAEFGKSLIVRNLRVMGNAAIQGSMENPGVKPLTVGDDLRVDGRIFRGANAGIGDDRPVKIDDSLTVAGDLTVAGSINGEKLGMMLYMQPTLAAGAKTSWSGAIHDVCNNTHRVTKVTVEFTPTSKTSGTWKSSPYNVFSPNCLLDAQGEYSGSYTAHEHILMAFNVKQPNGAATGTGFTSQAMISEKEITIVAMHGAPDSYTVLERN